MIDLEYTFGRPQVYLTDIERARLLIFLSKLRDMQTDIPTTPAKEEAN